MGDGGEKSKNPLKQPLLQDSVSGSGNSRENGKDFKCGGAVCSWADSDMAERSQDTKKLSRAVVFCIVFMIIEVIGGIKAGSMAVLTDAAHLLSDVASFAISLFAIWAGGWEANLRQTFGFYRLEILGALVSIQLIWLITGIILYEAFERLFSDDVEVDGRLMFIIASLGLLVNIAMMLLLDHGHGGGVSGHSHGHDHGNGQDHGDEEDGHEHNHEHEHDHEHKHEHTPKLKTKRSHVHKLKEGEEHVKSGHSHQHDHEHEHEHEHEQEQEQEQENEETQDQQEDSSGNDHEHNHTHEHKHNHSGHKHLHQHEEEEGGQKQIILTNSLSNRSAAVALQNEGHKTECVRDNITKGRRSNTGDTIIVCICDEVEGKPSESSGLVERSVRVTIDHGDNEGKSSPSSRKGNINVQGAYLHVLGDLIQSIGVMIGGAIIWYNPAWKIVDLLCTFFFSLVVLGTTIKMLRDILEVLMESTPRAVDARALQEGLVEIEGVVAVHELHIWAITVGKVLLACHVRIEPDADADDVLQEVIHYCDKKFKISHVTIQIERSKR